MLERIDNPAIVEEVQYVEIAQDGTPMEVLVDNLGSTLILCLAQIAVTIVMVMLFLAQ